MDEEAGARDGALQRYTKRCVNDRCTNANISTNHSLIGSTLIWWDELDRKVERSL
jgi:hypothetical protein